MRMRRCDTVSECFTGALKATLIWVAGCLLAALAVAIAASLFVGQESAERMAAAIGEAIGRSVYGFWPTALVVLLVKRHKRRRVETDNEGEMQ